jgi:hypothetical protein
LADKNLLNFFWPGKITGSSCEEKSHPKIDELENDMSAGLEGIQNFRFGQSFTYER